MTEEIDFERLNMVPHIFKTEDGSCRWCGCFPEEVDSEFCSDRPYRSFISEQNYKGQFGEAYRDNYSPYED